MKPHCNTSSSKAEPHVDGSGLGLGSIQRPTTAGGASSQTTHTAPVAAGRPPRGEQGARLHLDCAL